jgi:hypothetical protein
LNYLSVKKNTPFKNKNSNSLNNIIVSLKNTLNIITNILIRINLNFSVWSEKLVLSEISKALPTAEACEVVLKHCGESVNSYCGLVEDCCSRLTSFIFWNNFDLDFRLNLFFGYRSKVLNSFHNPLKVQYICR